MHEYCMDSSPLDELRFTYENPRNKPKVKEAADDYINGGCSLKQAADALDGQRDQSCKVAQEFAYCSPAII